VVLSKLACRCPSAPTSCAYYTPSYTPSNTTGQPHTNTKSTHKSTQNERKHTAAMGAGRLMSCCAIVYVCVCVGSRRLLEHRGSLVVRQLCVLLDAQHIYLSLAKVTTHTTPPYSSPHTTPPKLFCSMCPTYVIQ
jgi:hypothetical protein